MTKPRQCWLTEPRDARSIGGAALARARHPRRRASALTTLGAGLLLAAGASSVVHADGCSSLGLTACPAGAQGGRVLVDATFNVRDPASLVLDADEIQCALDCIDDDVDADGEPQPPWNTNTLISGGTVEFIAGIQYETKRPLLLPLGAFGSVVLRGNGARIELVSGIDVGSLPVFSRKAPPGANGCDVWRLMPWTNRWIIEGFVFDASGFEPWTNPPFRKGIEIHGANELVIRDCAFLGRFDAAVELHFVNQPVLENLDIAAAITNGVRIGDRHGCLGESPGPFMGDCWSECVNAPPIVLDPGGPVGTLADGLFRSNRVSLNGVRGVLSPGGLGPVVDLTEVDGAIVRRARFDGTATAGAWTGLRRTGALARPLIVRDAAILGAGGTMRAVFSNGAPGRFTLDGLAVEADGATLLADTTGTWGSLPSRLSLGHVVLLPDDVLFSRASTNTEFAGIDVEPLFATHDPSHWVGPPPADAALLGATASQLPAIPGGARGAFWHDGSVDRLLFCCAGSGQPLQVVPQ